MWCERGAVRAWWRRARRWRAAALGALLVALAAGGAAPRLAAVRARRADTLPHAPRAVAHLLADFSYHARLYPHIGAWSVVSDGGNYSWWRYEVRYACGARCAGRALLAAHERGSAPGPAPAHGPAHSHRVLLRHEDCAPALPPLPWPLLCDEWSTDTEVTPAAGGGALVREEATAACSLLGAASGACARRLRARRALAARRLAALLREAGPTH